MQTNDFFGELWREEQDHRQEATNRLLEWLEMCHMFLGVDQAPQKYVSFASVTPASVVLNIFQSLLGDPQQVTLAM